MVFILSVLLRSHLVLISPMHSLHCFLVVPLKSMARFLDNSQSPYPIPIAPHQSQPNTFGLCIPLGFVYLQAWFLGSALFLDLILAFCLSQENL